MGDTRPFSFIRHGEHMAMAAAALALVKAESLNIVASPTLNILAPIDRSELLSSSVDFTPMERRITILRRIVPLWDGL